jgi:uncharacterized protein (TIGR03435 family)
MIGALTDHLWQSTLFVLAASLVAAALRRHGAHVRHAVWFIASVKFLLPFAWLMSLGGALPRLTPGVTKAIVPATSAVPDLPVAVDRLAQPFTSDVFTAALPSAAPAALPWTAFAAVAWACGFMVVVLLRVRQWRRIRAAVRASVPLPFAGPVPLRASPSLLEPGIVGVWHPVLLVPDGIERRLTPSQFRAVLEHEFCHVRRRDNLTSAIHMVVEAAFWFHPLVWWIGARMLVERERACDEQVLRRCGEPQAYAESILEVCKLYVESPLACVSGVTGSDLKRRIAAIMADRVGVPMKLTGKLVLTTVALLAIGLPLAAGVLTSPLRASAVTAASTAQVPMGAGAVAGPTFADAGTAEQATGSSPMFDVVSIKPCPGTRSKPVLPPSPSGGRRGGSPSAAETSPGHVYWDCVSLAQLIEQAYADRDHPLLNTTNRARPDSFQPRRVRGGPSWVENERFTIEAKAPLDVTSPALLGRQSRFLATLPTAMSQALRATLEDRFQLKVRRAREEQPMYAMTIAKNGLDRAGVRPTQPGDCLASEEYFATDPASRGALRICGRYRVAIGSWEFTGGTFEQLAEALSSSMDYFVLDRTGLDGAFNFTIEFEPVSADNPSGDGRFVRALERLGLRIEETRGSAEHLVIEHVQKPRPDGGESAGR